MKSLYVLNSSNNTDNPTRKDIWTDKISSSKESMQKEDRGDSLPHQDHGYAWLIVLGNSNALEITTSVGLDETSSIAVTMNGFRHPSGRTHASAMHEWVKFHQGKVNALYIIVVFFAICIYLVDKSHHCYVYTFLVDSCDRHLEIIISLFPQLVDASPYY